MNDNRPDNTASLQEVHAYFRARTGGGEPKRYKTYPERGKYVVEIANRYCSNDATILDLGCNVGRNSEALRQAGFYKLYGIEINSYALDEMAREYSQLYKLMTLFNAPIETAIRVFDANEIDFAFTMTVLMHIHPDSERVFHEIARVTKVLLTIENEHSDDRCRWARDYGEIFQGFGATMIHNAMWNLGYGRDKYVVRVFDCGGVV